MEPTSVCNSEMEASKVYGKLDGKEYPEEVDEEEKWGKPTVSDLSGETIKISMGSTGMCGGIRTNLLQVERCARLNQSDGIQRCERKLSAAVIDSAIPRHISSLARAN